MKGSKKRLELVIDVLDKKDQLALAEPHLRPADLVVAILEEFRDEFRAREYLPDDPGAYRLLKGEDNALLDDEVSLELQVNPKARLVLAEAELPLPEGAHRPAKHIYLLDEATGKVYRLYWCPGIIGRVADGYEANEMVAVNLSGHEQGLRVSRRHAQIVEEDGRYYIESLSPQNPTMILDSGGNPTTVSSSRRLLKHGDRIYLEQSRITFKFIVQEEYAE